MAPDPMDVSPDSDEDFFVVTDDLKSLSALTLQPYGEQTIAFKHVNKDLPMPYCVGIILTRNGQIIYSGVEGATPWHGSFESGVGGHRQGLILKFHWKGKQPWPETRVRQDGDGIWRGLDYRCMEGGDDAYTR